MEAVIFLFLDDLQGILLQAWKRKGNYATELLGRSTQHDSATFSCKLGKLVSPLGSLSWCGVLLGCFVDFDAFSIDETEKKPNVALWTEFPIFFSSLSYTYAEVRFLCRKINKCDTVLHTPAIKRYGPFPLGFLGLGQERIYALSEILP